jgi:hypothetical protein
LLFQIQGADLKVASNKPVIRRFHLPLKEYSLVIPLNGTSGLHAIGSKHRLIRNVL